MLTYIPHKPYRMKRYVTGLPAWYQLETCGLDPAIPFLEFDMVTDEGDRVHVTTIADPRTEGDLHNGCQVVMWGRFSAVDIDEEPVFRADAVLRTAVASEDIDPTGQSGLPKSGSTVPLTPIPEWRYSQTEEFLNGIDCVRPRSGSKSRRRRSQGR